MPLAPPPRPEDLTKEDQQALLTGNITKVEQVGDEWRDDHIDCVAVRVHVDGRQINTSLWWCGPVIIGALKYADESPRAMADVLEELRSNVQNGIDCAEGEDGPYWMQVNENIELVRREAEGCEVVVVEDKGFAIIVGLESACAQAARNLTVSDEGPGEPDLEE